MRRHLFSVVVVLAVCAFFTLIGATIVHDKVHRHSVKAVVTDVRVMFEGESVVESSNDHAVAGAIAGGLVAGTTGAIVGAAAGNNNASVVSHSTKLIACSVKARLANGA